MMIMEYYRQSKMKKLQDMREEQVELPPTATAPRPHRAGCRCKADSVDFVAGNIVDDDDDEATWPFIFCSLSVLFPFSWDALAPPVSWCM